MKAKRILAFAGIGASILILIGLALVAWRGYKQEIFDLREQIATLEERQSNQDHEILRTQGKVEVIDASLNADTVRKTRIKKVKEVIKEEVSKLPKTVDYDPARNLNNVEITHIATYVIDAADKFDIPVPLLLGLIRQESAFRPAVVSKSGAIGYMQIIPSTADDIKEWTRDVEMPFNVRMYNARNGMHNIYFGTFYLAKLIHRFRNEPNRIEIGLMAYNGGPTLITKWKSGELTDDQLPKETREYSPRVLAFAKEFEAMGTF